MLGDGWRGRVSVRVGERVGVCVGGRVSVSGSVCDDMGVGASGGGLEGVSVGGQEEGGRGREASPLHDLRGRILCRSLYRKSNVGCHRGVGHVRDKVRNDFGSRSP